MENVDVSVWDAQATFELKPGKEFRPEIIRKAVTDAGFTPRDIFITVRGEFRKTKGGVTFQPVRSPQVFTILENAEIEKLIGEKLKDVGLVAKILGESSPYRLEIEKIE